MHNRALLGGMAVLIVFAVAAWIFLRERPDELDQEGRVLVQRFDAERSKEEPDEDARRQLLTAIRDHAQHETDPELGYAAAWLLFAAGSTQEALIRLEANIAPGVRTRRPEDLLLAARIFRQRHAEAGDVGAGHRAAALAREHYAMTGAPGSLFVAWQMAVRTGEDEFRKQHAATFERVHGDTQEARLVAALAGYPGPPADAARLRQLEREWDPLPEELEIALAWGEIEGGPGSRAAGIERCAAVLRRFPMSFWARKLLAMGSLITRDLPVAIFHLEWLIRHFPEHEEAEQFRQALAAARVEAGKVK